MIPKVLRRGEHARVTHPEDGSYLYAVTVLDIKGDRVTLGFEDGVRVTVTAYTKALTSSRIVTQSIANQ
jgi:hypothetical protein